VHALRRRLARTGRLPRVNPAVDCYNLISARFGVPAGAFDLAQVRGDIRVRFASGGETFIPLGKPGVTESPRPGEVIYADAEGVLTRHWNHRDAERTKVTAATSEIVVMLETTQSAAFRKVVDEAARALAGLLRERARRVTVQHITAASPAAWLPGG
jgi:DNA/RNA-binding domain of Phe-tRNA-synthetase-like protein